MSTFSLSIPAAQGCAKICSGLGLFSNSFSKLSVSQGKSQGEPSTKEVSKGCGPFDLGIWDIFQKRGDVGFEEVLDEVYRGQRRIAGRWERKSALGDLQESNSKRPQIRADTVSMARDSLGLDT